MLQKRLLSVCSWCCGVVIVLVTSGSVLAGYGPEITETGYAFDCGNAGAAYSAEKAFDNDEINTYFASSQTGASVDGNACIGQDFGLSAPDVILVQMKQHGTSSTRVNHAIIQVSNDCSSYSDVLDIYPPGNAGWNDFTFLSVGNYRCWRILAHDATGTGVSWGVIEIKMYEYAENTAVPTATNTPVATLTPANTPTPEPQISYLSTLSSSGESYQLERKATWGEIGIVTALILLVSVVLLAFLYWVINARTNR